MNWTTILGTAGDVASIVVAISAVGGALWFGARRSVSYLREFVAKPSVIRAVQLGLGALRTLTEITLLCAERPEAAENGLRLDALWQPYIDHGP